MTTAGKLLLVGEDDGMLIDRDYRKANNYLRQAMQAGDPLAKGYLEKYGVDGVIIAPLKQKEATYRFAGGYELTATTKTLATIQLYIGTRYKAGLIADAFADEYDNRFKSFKELMDGIYPLYGESVARMLQWSIMLLMSVGIDYYDVSEIINRCDDLGLLHRIPNFEQGLDAIDERATQLNMNLAYAQATRARWVGGGFGTTISGTIGAAIKGSVAAGVMNAGSGILHGIGDSISKAISNSEINGMMKKLFENSKTKTEFHNAVVSACYDVGDVIMDIMGENCDIGLEQLVGEIVYNGERLKSINDNMLDAKINNNLTIGDSDYGYALLLEKLRRWPGNTSVFQQLVALKGNASDASEVFRQYSGDFGLTETKN